MLAAIDAGSNTLRLLIGEANGRCITPFRYHRRITRLAGGFSDKDGLSRDARARTLGALQEFASICRAEYVTNCRAVGTAAFRDAINGEEFADEINRFTGIKLDIISGFEEASLMARGVLSVLSPRPEGTLIIDIGGGSTEFVLCRGDKVLLQKSLPLGVVVLTETLNSHDKSSCIDESVGDIAKEIKAIQDAAGDPMASLQLVGTAGTVTTLAALDMRMGDYDWERVNNYIMGYDRISKWQALLEPMTVAERETLPGMEAGRGDLIMVGMDIILCVMQKLDCTSLVISDFGILEGVLLELSGAGKT